ncbi:NUDIX domain-containing protein [Flavihumibacter rivuli]|uniref:NUDIX hydrolase n=1 Tax=Flavihumibacter rivuli TaxID=2838156 RepID=UPI001BDF6346|nr:NUDIX domain-containing protein [Flavihumibacter rivuli]ULQ57909.1 NUDIX domain-containing protein [Flavihumibacter rivuli]
MYIKVYFNANPLFLCDAIEPALEPYLHHDDAVFIDEFSLPAIKSMIHEMENQKVHAGIILHQDLEELKKAFWKKFTLFQAGGGAVWNEQNEILFMFRRGKWDLPKGKLDPNESIEECAIREVKEETGLDNITLVKPLITTYHTYHESGKHILKESYWFEMRVAGPQQLVPQTEEQITELKWLARERWIEVGSNTFPSIIDVLDCYR